VDSLNGSEGEKIMAKTMRVTFENGEVWDVPAAVVAKSRASFYALDEGEKGTDEYDAYFDIEFKFTLSNNDQLSDWSANNMNWSDLAPHAVRAEMPPVKPDYEDLWSSAQKEYIV
jgi:hypothetical protein